MSDASVLPPQALALWHFVAQAPMRVHVPPDGCRDLIVVAPRALAPACLVIVLADSTEMHVFGAGDRAVGVRLRPGVQLDERALAARLRAGERRDDADLLAAVDAAVRRDARVGEALDCLGEAPSLSLAHARLGVSARSLERLLSTHTQRGPLWWRNLARARRCARGLAGATPLAMLAADHGYADQAHMTRDLQRWFGASPSRLRAMPTMLAALASSGFS
ncbi:MAG TPA: helix-turn-helix domain-containing protein [Burkholderiaceae bacterium]